MKKIATGVATTVAATALLTGGLATPAHAGPAWNKAVKCKQEDWDGRVIPTRLGNSVLGWRHFSSRHNIRKCRIVNAALAGTHIYPGIRVSTVMGMTLVHVDPEEEDPVPPGPNDNAFTILRTLTYPYSEEEPLLRLRGFLLRDPDLLRLYFDSVGTIEVTAADVRPSGAITALLAALPDLITEEGRTVPDNTDPHCSRLVDVTDW